MSLYPRVKTEIEEMDLEGPGDFDHSREPVPDEVPSEDVPTETDIDIIEVPVP